MSEQQQKPSVGRMVHYVEPGIESSAACRAAIITEVYEEGTRAAGLVRLYAFLSGGPTDLKYVAYAPDACPLMWHWPERV